MHGNKNKKFKLELNEEQLLTLERALETYSRLGTKQYQIALSETTDCDYGTLKDIEEYIRLKEHCDLQSNASYGILEDKVDDRFRVSWDLYQVVRYCRAWSRAEHKPEERDKYFTKYMGVCYDTPLKRSEQPLAECECLRDEN
jgi:hypothetical protein